MGVNKLVYQGGPIIKNAQVQLIFWGSEWRDAALGASADQFISDLQRLMAGPYMLGLSQYGDIAPASIRSPAFFDYSSEPANPLMLSNLGDYIKSLISTGRVPDFQSNYQILYLVVTNGVSLDQNPAAFGYHYWHSVGNQTFHFAWVKSPDTGMASHEIIEACTDPEATGYLQPENGIEVADICKDNQDAFGLSDGIKGASYWSNTDGRCILPVRTAKISCSLDDCRIGPAQGGISTLKVDSIVISPAWIGTSNLQPLASPMYQWTIYDETIKALGPTNQSALQVQWPVLPDKYAAQIGVTITDDPGIIVNGVFNATPLTQAEYEVLNITCHFRRVLASINRLPPFLINRLGPDPAPMPTEKEIERLESVVGLLAKDVRQISSLSARLRERAGR